MVKKILHLQIPMGKSVDRLLLSPSLVNIFAKLIQNKLSDEWIVISSPMIPSMWNGDDFEPTSNFDMTQVTKEELMMLIGKENNE